MEDQKQNIEPIDKSEIEIDYFNSIIKKMYNSQKKIEDLLENNPIVCVDLAKEYFKALGDSEFWINQILQIMIHEKRVSKRFKENLDDISYFQYTLLKKFTDEDKKEQMANNIFVICDQREERSKIPEMIKEKKNVIVIIEILTNGDYLISSSCAFERKKGDDLKKSMIAGSGDTNIFDELIRAKEAFEVVILVVENKSLAIKLFKKNNESKSEYMIRKIDFANKIDKLLLSIQTIMGIPISYTKNNKETADLIYDIAKYHQNRKGHGISRRIPKTKSLEKRQKYFIEGFFNTGTTKADSIITEFKNPITFINALMDTEILKTRGGNPKGINGDLKKIKGLGYKYVLSNQELMGAIEFLDCPFCKKKVKIENWECNVCKAKLVDNVEYKPIYPIYKNQEDSGD